MTTSHDPPDERIKSRRLQLRELLEDGKWHTNIECWKAGGFPYATGISWLRSLGYRIESRRVERGVWEYRLTGKGDPPPKRLTPQQRSVTNIYEHALGTCSDSETVHQVREQLPDWVKCSAV